MNDREHGAPLGVLGSLLVVLGITGYVAYRLAAGTESHVFSPGAVPPHTVHVTANHNYQLSYPGGVAALAEQGVDLNSLQCDWMVPGSARQSLPVVPFDGSTEARNAVASFQAVVTGDIHVSCDGLGAMFVDGADNASGDVSGWYLLLSTLALTLGVPLAMSRMRLAARRRAEEEEQEDEDYEPLSVWLAGEDDEVERLVRIVHERAEDDEIGDADGGDVTH
jgi:hypothetical protein